MIRSSWSVLLTGLVLAFADSANAEDADRKIDLVFQEFRVGTPQVCRLAPSQQKARRIDIAPPTQPAAAAFGGGRPRWSPDGSQVAFFVNDDQHGTDIVIVNKDGSGWKQVTHRGISSDPAWSPDGKRLAIRAGEARLTAIHVLDLDTGELTVLADTPHFDRAPDWSPDGKHIVFSSGVFAERKSKEDIYIVDVETGSYKPIIEKPGRDTAPRFSPDGLLIAWTGIADGTHQIFICTPDGKNIRQVTSEGANWDPAWSPDGKMIYCTTKKNEVFAITAINVTTGVIETAYVTKTRVNAPDVRAAAAKRVPK